MSEEVWKSLQDSMVLENAPDEARNCVKVDISETEECSALLTSERMRVANRTMMAELRAMPVQTSEQYRKKSGDMMQLWKAGGALSAWEKKKVYEELFAELDHVASSSPQHASAAHNVAQILKAGRGGDPDASNGTSSSSDKEAGGEDLQGSPSSDASSQRGQVANAEVRPHVDHGQPNGLGRTPTKAGMDAANSQVKPPDHMALDINPEGSGTMARHTDIAPTEPQVQPGAMRNFPHEFLQSEPKSGAPGQLTMAAFMVYILVRSI